MNERIEPDGGNPYPELIEPCEWTQPAYWEREVHISELAERMLNDPKIEAAQWLLYNREKARQLHGWREALHTVPSAEHYRNTYLWDSGFFIDMYAETGLLAAHSADYLEDLLLKGITSEPEQEKIQQTIAELHRLSREFLRAAVTESFWVVDGQKENGMIPNLQYAPGPPRWFDVEWWFSTDKKRRSSNYTQPPVLAMSTLAAYNALQETGDENADIYLKGMMPYLHDYYDFFLKHRSNSPDDPMIGVVNPHETGQDSSIQWDCFKPNRPPDKGPDHDEDQLFGTRIIDGAYAVMMQFETYAVAGLNPVKQRELFWANDVSMNSIYFHNLRMMTRLSELNNEPERAEHYRALAEAVEQSMLENMWITDETKVRQTGFYSLKADGEPIDKITDINFFALLLPNISQEQLTTVLDLMDEHMHAPFPLPSGSVKDPAFDPHNIEKDRLWRGSTWINANWYLAVHGLRMQARREDISQELKVRCLERAILLAKTSEQLLRMNHKTDVSAARALGGLIITRHLKGKHADRFKKFITGAREFYDPMTGEGQRDKVVNFGWSWLGEFMRTEQLEYELALALSA